MARRRRAIERARARVGGRAVTTLSVARQEGLQPDSGLVASLAELVTAFAFGLDAAEGREPGHAARVGYIATLLVRALALGDEAGRAAFHAGLLHDVGVPIAAAGLLGVPGVDEELIFGFAPQNDLDAAEVPRRSRGLVQQVLATHVSAGAEFLTTPWFPDATYAAVRASHENWDGSGYPASAKGEAIPVVGRVVRAADLFESVVSGETNPLTARARCRRTIRAWAGREIDPRIAVALAAVSEDDSFWLGFYGDAVAERVLTNAPAAGVPSSDALLWSFSEAAADLVDAKAGHERGRAQRVAHYARGMATRLDMSPARAESIALAALWNDLGALGVPARILVKRDLLTVEEMQRVQSHPAFSAEILRRLPALEPAAAWVAAHHERLDGNGYPEMLSGSMIPTEAGILSIADAYVAMTSRRPYREALSHKDARAMLEAGAGSQWDPFLVKVMLDLLGQESASADGETG